MFLVPTVPIQFRILSIYFIIHLGALNSKNETCDQAEAESTDDATTDEQAEQNKNESDKTIVTESITNAVMEVYFISKGGGGCGCFQNPNQNSEYLHFYI